MPNSGFFDLYDTVLKLADELLQDNSPIAEIPRYAMIVDDVLLQLKVLGRTTWTAPRLEQLEADDPSKFSSITESLDQMMNVLKKMQWKQEDRSDTG